MRRRFCYLVNCCLPNFLPPSSLSFFFFYHPKVAGGPLFVLNCYFSSSLSAFTSFEGAWLSSYQPIFFVSGRRFAWGHSGLMSPQGLSSEVRASVALRKLSYFASKASLKVGTPDGSLNPCCDGVLCTSGAVCFPIIVDVVHHLSFSSSLGIFLRSQRGYGSLAPIGEVEVKFGSRGSLGENLQQLKLVTKSGSRRSPDGVLPVIGVADGARLP